MTNAIRLGKKTFTWSVVVMTILWSMGIAALMPTVVNAAECPTLEAGDLFKVPNNSAVYLLNADMNRLYFPHSTVYHTWYEDFSGVVEIPNTCVDAYPAPSSAPFGVNYRPGSTLVKVQISPSVYVVEPGNKKSKLGSEEVAKALYGDNWASKVVDIADVFWPNYSATGDEITEAVPHNGMLVKTSGSATVYFVKDSELLEVDGSVRDSGDVQVVSQAVLDSVSTGSGTVTSASLYSDPTEGATSTETGTTPTSVGTLTVALASDTPTGQYGYDGQARLAFTKVNFTASGGDVVIKTMKVLRGGVGIDTDFSKVNIVKPDGNLLNEAGKTLNSDHIVTFSEDITVKSGTTATYTLVGDMAASVTGGNVPTLALYSVETASTVVGSLPLSGNPVSLNTSVTLGTSTVTEGAQVGSVTKQVGQTGINLANLQVTVATEDFQVERITLYNAGTANGGTDVTNLRMTYNNNEVGTGVWDGKYVSFDLSGCTADCKIQKGNNKTFAVFGDLMDGSTRTINLDVKRQSHVLTKELNTNVYVLPTNSASAMTNTVTISQGKLNVTKVNNVPTGNIPENTNSLELGSWNFKVTGEPIDISTLVFRITTTGTVVPTGIDALTLYDANGNALISGTDGVGATSPGYATSTDTISLPVGDNILTLKGNIDSTPAANDTLTIAIDMRNSTNFDSTGVDSGETITLNTYATPQAVVSANTQTINTATLRVTTLSSPPAQTYAPGTSNVTFAKVQFDATGSSEDIKVTQVLVNDVVTTGLSIDIQNILLWVDKDGDSYNGSGTPVALAEVNSGSDSTAGNDEEFTFNLSGADQFVVKKGKILVVEIRGDIAGGATAGTHNFQIIAANKVTAIGVSTNNTVSEIIDTATGNAMTVGTSGGTVQVSIDNSNPSAKLFASGTQGATLAAFNFSATTTEDVEIEWIQFTQLVTDTASSSYLDYNLLYLEDENGVTLGSMVPTTTSPVMTFTGNAFVVNKDDSDGQIIYLKANLSNIGTSYNVSVGGHRVGFSIAAASDLKAKGNQTGSDAVEYLGSSAPTGNTHYMYKALPTVTKLAVGGTLANGENDLYKFKVTAGSGDIDLYKFVFDVATTTATVSNVELLDVTETTEVSLYSSATSGFANGYFQVLFDTNSSGTGSGGEARTVSVSTPRTYVLRGTVTGAASGASVSTRLAGDAATWVETSTLMAAAGTIDSDVHDDFIWSDRSAASHATTTADWVNGYLVGGLNSASTTASVVAL